MLKQIAYKSWLILLSLPLTAVLLLMGWKKNTLAINLKMLAITPPTCFRVRLYWHASKDFLAFLHGHPENPIYVSQRDQVKLDRIKGSGTLGGCLLLAAHFHNWEAMAAWLCRQGIPLLGSALPLRHALAQGALDHLRKRQGIFTAGKKILPTALKHLGRGGSVGVLWDQHSPHARESAFFFGHSVGLNPLPGFLIRHAEVRTFVTLLLPGGRLRLLDLGTTPIGWGAADLGKRYHRILERAIRAFPAYWYGFLHGRFKDQIDYGNRRTVSRETSGMTPG